MEEEGGGGGGVGEDVFQRPVIYVLCNRTAWPGYVLMFVYIQDCYRYVYFWW